MKAYARMRAARPAKPAMARLPATVDAAPVKEAAVGATADGREVTVPTGTGAPVPAGYGATLTTELKVADDAGQALTVTVTTCSGAAYVAVELWYGAGTPDGE